MKPSLAKQAPPLLRKVLVPLDGSEEAAATLPTIDSFSREAGTEILLLHVVPLTASPVPDVPAALLEKLDTDARHYLDQAAQRPELRGFPLRLESRVGPVAETILEMTQRENASLIAMATHGRSGFSRWVLGSVAETILRQARVPLLLTRSDAGTPAPRKVEAFRRILIPLDGSENARKAVPFALQFARAFGARVDLLQVEETPLSYPPGAYHGEFHAPPEAIPSVLESLKKEADVFLREGIPTTVHTAKGNPVTTILKFCDDLSIDMIAMGTHGHRGMARLVLGSVTEEVLRLSRVPLLVVRGKTDEK